MSHRPGVQGQSCPQSVEAWPSTDDLSYPVPGVAAGSDLSGAITESSIKSLGELGPELARRHPADDHIVHGEGAHTIAATGPRENRLREAGCESRILILRVGS